MQQAAACSCRSPLRSVLAGLRHNPVQHFRPPHIATSVPAGVVRAMQSAGPDSTQAHGLLEMFKRAVPKLDGSNYKGQHGKVGVVGGSNTYTGAPFFAAMAAHKVGADMTFTLTHPAAVPTIRGYSPDMMVSSMLPWSPMQEGSFDMEKWLKRLTVVVVGPGLDISSDPEMLLATEHLLKLAVAQELPLVIDGSGFDLLTRHQASLDLIKGYKRAVLTPNISELGRLAKALGQPLEGSMGSAWQQQLARVATQLEGPLLVSKGPSDIIIARRHVSSPGPGPTAASDDTLLSVRCDQQASLKRCGGQGDVLAGILATFIGWQQTAQAREQPASDLCDAHPYQAAAFAACTLLRTASKASFERKGRAMLSLDVIEQLHPTFCQMFGE